MKSLKSQIIYTVLSANHGPWTLPPVLWSLFGASTRCRRGSDQVLIRSRKRFTEKVEFWRMSLTESLVLLSPRPAKTGPNLSPRRVLALKCIVRERQFFMVWKRWKKVKRKHTSHGGQPWPGPIESIKNTKSGSQKSKLAPYRRSLCKLRSSREQDVWAGCKIESPYRDLRRIETEGGSMSGLAWSIWDSG